MTNLENSVPVSEFHSSLKVVGPVIVVVCFAVIVWCNWYQKTKTGFYYKYRTKGILREVLYESVWESDKWNKWTKICQLLTRGTMLGLFIYAWTIMNDPGGFIFYTIWNFFLVTLYSVWMMLYSLMDFVPAAGTCNFIRKARPFSDFLAWLLLQQQLTSNTIVTCCYWTLTTRFTTNRKMIEFQKTFPCRIIHGYNLLYIVLEYILGLPYVDPCYIYLIMICLLSYLAMGTLALGVIPSIPVNLSKFEASVVLIIVFGVMVVTHSLFVFLSAFINGKRGLDSRISRLTCLDSTSEARNVQLVPTATEEQLTREVQQAREVQPSRSNDNKGEDLIS